MPEPLARSDDIPAYDTYPSPAAPEELRMRSAYDPEFAGRGNPRLNDAAERIGSAVGRAVGKVRDLPGRLQDVRQRFTVIRGGGRSSELKEKASEMGDRARVEFERARSRASHLAHEYPLHTILAGAAAGLALGIALRIWRSHRG